MSGYCIKRTYNRHGDHDYLVAQDPEFVTVCSGRLATNIIQYADKVNAEAVIAEINAAYSTKFPDCDHKFEVAAFPPSN